MRVGFKLVSCKVGGSLIDKMPVCLKRGPRSFFIPGPSLRVHIYLKKHLAILQLLS